MHGIYFFKHHNFKKETRCPKNKFYFYGANVFFVICGLFMVFILVNIYLSLDKDVKNLCLNSKIDAIMEEDLKYRCNF